MTRKLKTALTGIGVLAILLAAGCPETAPEQTIIAEVNDDRLTKEELNALVPEGYSLDRENLPRIADKWVSNALMYQEAVRRGVTDDPRVEAYLRRLERDFVVNELLRQLTDDISVSQTEMLEYFNKNRDAFADEVKIRRLVLPDSLLAAQTLAELRQGADFVRLARERSQDQLLPAGEESGFLPRGFGDPRGGGDPALEEAVFSLQKGETSGVVATQEGYQIIQLTDRRRVRADPSFAESQDYIRAIITYRKGEEMVDSLLVKLRADARIEIRPEAYFRW